MMLRIQCLLWICRLNIECRRLTIGTAPIPELLMVGCFSIENDASLVNGVGFVLLSPICDFSKDLEISAGCEIWMWPVGIRGIVHPRHFVGGPRSRTVYFVCSIVVNALMRSLVGAVTRKSSVVTPAVIFP